MFFFSYELLLSIMKSNSRRYHKIQYSRIATFVITQTIPDQIRHSPRHVRNFLIFLKALDISWRAGADLAKRTERTCIQSLNRKLSQNVLFVSTA